MLQEHLEDTIQIMGIVLHTTNNNNLHRVRDRDRDNHSNNGTILSKDTIPTKINPIHFNNNNQNHKKRNPRP